MTNKTTIECVRDMQFNPLEFSPFDKEFQRVIALRAGLVNPTHVLYTAVQMKAVLVLSIFLSFPCFADVRFEQNLTRRKAYMFGMRDLADYYRGCESLSGEQVVCETQRSLSYDPIYFGLGFNLAVASAWKFGIEADVTPYPIASTPLVPSMELDRGVTVKGRLKLDLL